jgi:hypothetical protein
MLRSLLLIITTLFIFTSVQSQNAVDKSKFHEFDFWLGEWDVYVKTDLENKIAESYIQSVIDSFAIQENYSVIGGPYQGKSFNKYNPQLDRWEQFWVDNGGLSLFITGGLNSEGKMILASETKDDLGIITINQISWQFLKNGQVNQIWKSKVGDAEWAVLFDGIYKRKSE